MKIKNISVVIPSRRNKYLKEVLKYIHPFFSEIIVVGTYESDSPDEENIKYVYKDNLNSSQARNYGSTFCNNSYILFLDSDCLPTEDFIKRVFTFR